MRSLPRKPTAAAAAALLPVRLTGLPFIPISYLFAKDIRSDAQRVTINTDGLISHGYTRRARAHLEAAGVLVDPAEGGEAADLLAVYPGPVRRRKKNREALPSIAHHTESRISLYSCRFILVPSVASSKMASPCTATQLVSDAAPTAIPRRRPRRSSAGKPPDRISLSAARRRLDPHCRSTALKGAATCAPSQPTRR